jgi:predicted nucleotidyltransferase
VVRLDDLGAIVERYAWLDALVVFGSHARGTARSSSDLDLAYLGTPTGSLIELEGRLGLHVLRDVDLVSLHDQGVTFAFEIARTGKLIFERQQGIWTRWQAEACIRYDEMRPLMERGRRVYLAAVARGAR